MKFSVLAFGALFIIAFLYTRNLYSTCYIIKQSVFPVVVLFFIIRWFKKNSPVSRAKKNLETIFDKMIEENNTKLPNGGDLYLKHYDIHILRPVKRVYKEKQDYYLEYGSNKLKICFDKNPRNAYHDQNYIYCYVELGGTAWYLTDKDANYYLRAIC